MRESREETRLCVCVYRKALQNHGHGQKYTPSPYRTVSASVPQPHQERKRERDVYRYLFWDKQKSITPPHYEIIRKLRGIVFFFSKILRRKTFNRYRVNTQLNRSYNTIYNKISCIWIHKCDNKVQLIISHIYI